MKAFITKYLFTLIFACSNLFAFAQKKQNVYFLKNNDKIVFNKDSAEYIRIIQEPDSGEINYILKEFYPDGAKKRLGAVSKFEPQLILEGSIIEFYKNGKRKSIENYVMNAHVGEAYYYYQNGVLKETKFYFQIDKKKLNDSSLPNYKTIQVADSLGHNFLDINGNGKTSLTQHNGDSESGEYLSGYKNGLWKTYNSELKETYEDEYLNGKFIKGRTINADGTTLEYDVLEILPLFNGGEEIFAKFLGKNLNYPPQARNNKVQGRVYLKFEVEKTGKLIDFEVTKGVSPDLDKEALRVIKLSPNWLPGKYRGKPISMSYTFPIFFQLQ